MPKSSTTAPGTGWVAGRLVELADRRSPCAIVVDDTGPAGSLVAPPEEPGLEVIRPTARARAAADGGFYDAVAERSLRYVPRPALDAAVAGAQKRPARRRLGVGPLGAVDRYHATGRSVAGRWGHATRAHLHNREPSIYL